MTMSRGCWQTYIERRVWFSAHCDEGRLFRISAYPIGIQGTDNKLLGLEGFIVIAVIFLITLALNIHLIAFGGGSSSSLLLHLLGLLLDLLHLHFVLGLGLVFLVAVLEIILAERATDQLQGSEKWRRSLRCIRVGVNGGHGDVELARSVGAREAASRTGPNKPSGHRAARKRPW